MKLTRPVNLVLCLLTLTASACLSDLDFDSIEPTCDAPFADVPTREGYCNLLVVEADAVALPMNRRIIGVAERAGRTVTIVGTEPAKISFPTADGKQANIEVYQSAEFVISNESNVVDALNDGQPAPFSWDAEDGIGPLGAVAILADAPLFVGIPTLGNVMIVLEPGEGGLKVPTLIGPDRLPVEVAGGPKVPGGNPEIGSVAGGLLGDDELIVVGTLGNGVKVLRFERVGGHWQERIEQIRLPPVVPLGTAEALSAENQICGISAGCSAGGVLNCPAGESEVFSKCVVYFPPAVGAESVVSRPDADGVNYRFYVGALNQVSMYTAESLSNDLDNTQFVGDRSLLNEQLTSSSMLTLSDVPSEANVFQPVSLAADDRAVYALVLGGFPSTARLVVMETSANGALLQRTATVDLPDAFAAGFGDIKVRDGIVAIRTHTIDMPSSGMITLETTAIDTILFDVTDLTSPLEVGRFDSSTGTDGTTASLRGLYMAGKSFLIPTREGLQKIDVDEVP